MWESQTLAQGIDVLVVHCEGEPLVEHRSRSCQNERHSWLCTHRFALQADQCDAHNMIMVRADHLHAAKGSVRQNTSRHMNNNSEKVSKQIKFIHWSLPFAIKETKIRRIAFKSPYKEYGRLTSQILFE
jgi:hypothetical protein